MRSSSAWASRPVQNDLRALGEGRGRRPGAASDVACVCVCVCVCVQMAQSEMLHVRCARRLLVRFGDREALYSTTISSLGA